MIRQIVVPTEREFTLRLPAEMIGKNVEILAFVVSEEGQADADNEAEAPTRDTFLSYLQHSGFASRRQPGRHDEPPKPEK